MDIIVALRGTIPCANNPNPKNQDFLFSYHSSCTICHVAAPAKPIRVCSQAADCIGGSIRWHEIKDH